MVQRSVITRNRIIEIIDLNNFRNFLLLSSVPLYVCILPEIFFSNFRIFYSWQRKIYKISKIKVY